MNDPLYDSEEDLFFEPPKLSSYSMALLNNNILDGYDDMIVDTEKQMDVPKDDDVMVDLHNHDDANNNNNEDHDLHKSHSESRYEDAITSFKRASGNIDMQAKNRSISNNQENAQTMMDSSAGSNQQNAALTPSPVVDQFSVANPSKNSSVVSNTMISDEINKLRTSPIENNNRNLNVVSRVKQHNITEFNSNNDIGNKNIEVLNSSSKMNNSSSSIYRRHGISSRIPSIPLGQPRRISGTNRKSDDQQSLKDNNNQYHTNLNSINTGTTTLANNTNNGNFPNEWNLKQYPSSNSNGKLGFPNDKENARDDSISPPAMPTAEDVPPSKVLNAYRKQSKYSGIDGDNSSNNEVKIQEDIMYEKLRDIRSKQERLSFKDKRDVLKADDELDNINGLRVVKRFKNFESYNDNNDSRINDGKIIKVNNIEYEKLELIGKGGSSKVYKVKKITNNKIYAIKEVNLEEFDESSINGFKGEINLLLKLRNSRRVVKLIDYSMNEKRLLSLVMECGDIDLAHVLSNSNRVGGFFEQEDVETIRFYSKEILRCVSEVHDNDIVHSDLKPANFLFVKGVLKLIDFGISNAVPDHTVNIYRDSQIGTPNYMAPEALINLPNNDNSWKVGKPSDVWSCGCIIYQMVYGKPPYGHIQGNQRLLAIMNPEFEIKFPEWNVNHKFKVPRSLIHLLKSCLVRDPKKRATIHQLLDKNQFLNPKVITKELLRDLIGSAIKHGAENGMVSNDEIHGLCDDIWQKLDHLNY